MSKDNTTDYRCKSCNTIVPRGSHLKMESCKCGKVQVDRGWYGSRVLWTDGEYADVVEVIPSKATAEPAGE